MSPPERRDYGEDDDGQRAYLLAVRIWRSQQRDQLLTPHEALAYIDSVFECFTKEAPHG